MRLCPLGTPFSALFSHRSSFVVVSAYSHLPAPHATHTFQSVMICTIRLYDSPDSSLPSEYMISPLSRVSPSNESILKHARVGCTLELPVSFCRHARCSAYSLQHGL
ncbi:hypothetical protein BDN70DRAFT_885658 [Pholiota conissans]|uniref:Uncharacterized protein n=1 Tax=Pholiota conissans TaxID=109636 RepID=A0A9P6CP74_9AGAR|nr:hypothetical protein BDN70DRAFT_885658 [Pholiota conissans]